MSVFFKWLHRLEDAVLASLLLVMIILAAVQIALRNFFESGVIWIDPLLSVMVLWLALLGAMAASRSKEHVVIDVISQWLPRKLLRGVEVFACGATAVIAAFVAWYGYRLVLGEYQYSVNAFASVPVWLTQIIIPIAFAMIALRYAVHSLRALVGKPLNSQPMVENV